METWLMDLSDPNRFQLVCSSLTQSPSDSDPQSQFDLMNRYNLSSIIGDIQSYNPSSQYNFLRLVNEVPRYFSKDFIDKLIFQIVESTTDENIKKLGLQVMKKWLKVGGFQSLVDPSQSRRRALVLDYVQNASISFDIGNSEKNESNSRGNDQESKKRRLNETENQVECINVEETVLLTQDDREYFHQISQLPWIEDIFYEESRSNNDNNNSSNHHHHHHYHYDNISLPKSMNSEQSSTTNTNLPTVVKNITVPKAVVSSDIIIPIDSRVNESELRTACMNIATQIKKINHTSTSRVINSSNGNSSTNINNHSYSLSPESICDILSKLSNLSSTALIIEFSNILQLRHLSEEMIVAVSESLSHQRKVTSMEIVLFLCICILPKARTLSSPASRLFVRAIEIISKYDSDILFKYFLSRLLCQHQVDVVSNIESSVTVNKIWTPNQSQYELTQRFIKQSVPKTAIDTVITTICNLSPFGNQQLFRSYDNSKESDRIQKKLKTLVESLDGDISSTKLIWTSDVSKLFTFLLSMTLELRSETISLIINILQDCGNQKQIDSVQGKDENNLFSSPATASFLHNLVTKYDGLLTNDSVKTLKTILNLSKSTLSKSTLSLLESKGK